jgi:LacI family transcriptional regulator
VVLEKIAPQISSIDFDNVHGATAAAKHLIGLGRRRIGFLGYSERGIPYRRRHEGYRAACLAAGLEVDPRLTEPLGMDGFAEAGRRGVRHLIESGIDFDALLCVCDETALAAMQTLADYGKRVPAEVAVVGYDDHPLAASATPALTTVRQDGVEMGRRAMEMLHRQIETGDITPSHQLIEPKLIVRRSCGAERNKSNYILPGSTF